MQDTFLIIEAALHWSGEETSNKSFLSKRKEKKGSWVQESETCMCACVRVGFCVRLPVSACVCACEHYKRVMEWQTMHSQCAHSPFAFT